MEKKTISVEVFVDASPKEVWTFWTEPRHIIKWNQPSADWRTSRVENEPITGGKFLYVMEAKDGSAGFDFQGVYDRVIPLEMISCTLSDGRKATNTFTGTGEGTTITEIFEPEPGLSEEDQRIFVTSVLESFRLYVEGH